VKQRFLNQKLGKRVTHKAALQKAKLTSVFVPRKNAGKLAPRPGP